MQKLAVSALLEQFAGRLELSWICGRRGAATRSLAQTSSQTRPSLVGYLNLIHPNRLQILGREELDWLDRLDARQRWQTVAEILDAQPAAIILASGGEPGRDLEEQARDSATPLLVSPRPGWELVSTLDYEIHRLLAHSEVRHGVFMEIFTLGVLITGDAGAGKSELALELITRGHRLIADDCPEFTQVAPDTIDGTCPDMLRDCLEVRGLGVLNVRRMFGDAAVKANKYLRLIVHLSQPEKRLDPGLDRLAGRSDTARVLDLDIPRVLLPVLPGRNMAVITEAAVRNYMLQMKGYDATTELLNRHERLMDDGS
ncbi:MAG: HPr(Ser) kinase/phosphatase [Wenzhouxiangellaceae bacterium]|nr:HPr(Ser) kinase/phosphatase [Wenzhouxiangellaceae bacterium]